MIRPLLGFEQLITYTQQLASVVNDLNNFFNLNTLIFLYLLWFFIVVTAVIVITTVHPIHSILALIAVFIEIGALLLFLGLEYIAFVFLVVYVGAIAVLFLFVTMMLNIRQLQFNISVLAYLPATIFIAFAFFLNFIFLYFTKTTNFNFPAITQNYLLFFQKHSITFATLPGMDDSFFFLLARKVCIAKSFFCSFFYYCFAEVSEQLFINTYFFTQNYSFEHAQTIFNNKQPLLKTFVESYFFLLVPLLNSFVSFNIADILYTLTNIEVVANTLYTYFTTAFLASAIVLLVAMLGSISLTLYHKSNIKRQLVDKQWLRDFIVTLK